LVVTIIPSFFEICLVIGILWLNYDIFFTDRGFLCRFDIGDYNLADEVSLSDE
jgi:hypothetical protein